MFGYVRPYESEMLVREYEQYKAAYCELCNELGKSFGVFTRLSLSYDITLYAVLALSVGSSSVEAAQRACRANPLKKCTYLKSSGDEYKKAAGLSVIMTYHKFSDTCEDEGFFKSLAARIGAFAFRRKYKKARKLYPTIAEAAEEMMREQHEAEAEEKPSIDKCCEPTAKMLSTVCRELSEDTLQKTALAQFGYYLGRWIYMMDAADDLKDDLEKKSFNPLIKRLGLEKYIGDGEGLPEEERKRAEEFCNEALNADIAMIIPAMNLIDMEKFQNIVYNVVEKGLPEVQREILFLRVKERKNDKSV